MKIEEIRMLLLDRGERVSTLEMTSGNYDDSGNPINEDVHTITTPLCEIGGFQDALYMTCIVYSKGFLKEYFKVKGLFNNKNPQVVDQLNNKFQ